MKTNQNTVRWAVACGLSLAVGCAQPRATSRPTKTPTAAKAPPPVFADAQVVADAPGIGSKVTEVTVYSDRARVTREAIVEIGAEPTLLAFRRLPGWVDDGSVRVSTSAGQIVDVRVERNFLARPTDTSWQKAEAEHKALQARLATLKDEVTVLDAKKKQIESIKAFSLEKITQDTIIGDVKVESYSDVLDFITDALRKTAADRRKVEQRMAALTPEVEASQRTLDELQSLMKLEQTTVLVAVQGNATASSTIKLTYMMPGATWEPMHELRASTSNSKKVEVISFASVTQTSGEDWGDARLSFSTQSSTQSVRIPELEALTLGDTTTATRILSSKESSFTRAQKAYEGQNQLWNKVHQSTKSSNFEHVYKQNIQSLHVVQSKTVKLFETLQKRGTTAHFNALAAPIVRGDGHSVRMRIGRAQLKSQQKLIAAPEQSLNAARTLAMINSSGQSLLPGKVALYQDGAFLGMTDMNFIAKGESFSLFLSVADHIKLSRKLDRKKSSLIRRKRNKMHVAFIVTVENLSPKATRLSLADRIPVSENRDIRVERVKIAPAIKPDSQGLLHWELSLKPHEKRQFRISYQVEYPAQLVIDTERRRMQRKRSPQASPLDPYDIQEQIYDIESMF